VERISESKPDSAIQRVLDGLARVHEDDEAADGVMVSFLTTFAPNSQSALTADLDVSSLPEHASPPSRSSGELTTDLLPHQSQALEWMLAHERPSLPGEDGDAVQLWVRKRGATGTYFLNVATRTPQSSPPALGRGGIIADGMGLGKTLTTLALVLASRGDKVGKGVSKATLVGEFNVLHA
jgi:SWI/SNF-related matrix-associated actin-dependent regulator of chromatin subfamily A3